MKTMNRFVLGVATLLLAVASQAQTTTLLSSPRPSIRDNPGTLGHTYADLNYSWADYHRDSGLDADGYIAGLSANTPVMSGLDFGLGYNYYRENNHRNPFTNTPYDARFHGLGTGLTWYAPTGSMKPFLSGGVGYQWSRGDIQSLRTYDHEWTWGASAGVQMAMGLFSLTPRVSYSDLWRDGSIGSWHYGAEAHHWFNEKVGGYVDATFHDPRRGGGVEWWTYTAGVRLRF
jgi:hypothetical protein